jgi:predicted nucleic acid-binding protein
VYKLVKTSYINVNAPFKLKEELNDKIDTVLKINHDLAHKYADELLESIIIKDAFWIDEWKKANNLIGHIDIDDVPYLALSFHVESHGIISNDKIFHKQNHSRVWNIHDTERIITSYNSGFISFCFISSIGIIFKLIWDVIFAIFKVIGDILTDLIYGIGLIIGGMYKLLKNIPKDIIILLISIGVIALIFSQDFRKNGQNILIKTGDFIKNVFEKIIELIDWISSILIEFREMFKPVGLLSINFVGYLILEFDLMKQEVLKLERERAK